MREHHDMDVLADDDTSSRVVGELRVVREAECLEEGERSREISDGQIDKDLGTHRKGSTNFTGVNTTRSKS